MSNSKPKDHIVMALAFASINALMLSGASMIAKLLTRHFSPIEVTFFRDFAGLAIFVVGMILLHKYHLVKTHRPWAHLLRSVLGTIGILMGIWAYSLMPMAETTVLYFTSPFFAIALSFLFLKEKVGLLRVTAIVIGFLGVWILSTPAQAPPMFNIIIGLGYAFFSATVDVCLRWIGKTESTMTTTFYLLLISSVITALYLPFSDTPLSHYSENNLMLISLMGALSLLAVLAKTQSFRLGAVSLVSPVIYTMVIWAILFDYLVWDKSPGLNTLAGAAIIIASNLFILHRVQSRKEKSRST